jgi:hypothetical protein
MSENWFKSKAKIVKEKEEKERQKELYKKMSTQELRDILKSNEGINEYAQKEFDKRKDKTAYERLGDAFGSLIHGGIIVFIVGLIYIGAIASYFHVNDEFVNPTNITNGTHIGYANAFNHIQNITTQEIFIKLHDIGAKNPTLWFWLWWFVVFYFMILPILKFVYYSTKSKLGGKNGN